MKGRWDEEMRCRRVEEWARIRIFNVLILHMLKGKTKRLSNTRETPFLHKKERIYFRSFLRNSNIIPHVKGTSSRLNELLIDLYFNRREIFAKSQWLSIFRCFRWFWLALEHRRVQCVEWRTLVWSVMKISRVSSRLVVLQQMWR